MRTLLSCAVLAVVGLSASLVAQDATKAVLTPLSINLSPQVHIPVLDPDNIIDLSYGGMLGLGYSFAGVPGLAAGINLGFSYGGVKSAVTTLKSGIVEGTLGLNAAYAIKLAPWFDLRPFLGANLVLGSIAGDTASTSLYGSAEAGLGLNFNLDPQWTVRLDGGFLYNFGGTGAVRAGASVVWNIPEANGGRLAPTKLRLLDFTEVKLGSVFPIMQTYYDDHPVGSVRITNTGKVPASNVKVTFLMRQYMDAPKDCLTIPELAPGESKDVALFALFKNNILDVTEATKATAEVGVEYSGGGDLQSQTSTASIRVYDRNAMTWDDDRKAAAFVSGKDPWVLELSNNITAAVKDLRNEGLPKNLQTAMAFHAGLRLYGLSYVTNPKNPFAQAFANPETVDFLKFPRQTLAYKAGDCSDLSILYASFFESVGVETAFVTVPGHIFMAINLEMSQSAARAVLSGADDLFVVDGKTWLPLEVTMRDGGLQDIWREAAREWRQGESTKTLAFYPMHEAWKTFAPVGLAADNTSADALAKSRVSLAFESELNKLVDQELNRKMAALNDSIKKAPTAKAYNDRGVLYARFGKLAEAEKDFKAASAKSDYVPALINLGNVSYLKLDNAGAYAAYQRAVKISPNNPKLQVNLAKAAIALGKVPEAAKAMETVKQIDPVMATQYASVAMAATETGTRAASRDDLEVLWADE